MRLVFFGAWVGYGHKGFSIMIACCKRCFGTHKAFDAESESSKFVLISKYLLDFQYVFCLARYFF